MYLRHVRMSVICKCQCFCLSDIQKRSVFFLKYHFLCHRSFHLEEIQLSGNCYVSILNFYSPKDPQYTSLKTYYKTHYCCIFFDLTSPNVLRRTLKNYLFRIHTVLENRQLKRRVSALNLKTIVLKN